MKLPNHRLILLMLAASAFARVESEVLSAPEKNAHSVREFATIEEIEAYQKSGSSQVDVGDLCSPRISTNKINDAIGDFSLRLLRETASHDGQNTIISAYSIFTALGMCLVGSRGETHVNMKDILALGAMSSSDIENGFRDSLAKLMPSEHSENGQESFVLSLANRIYLNKSLSLSKTYSERISDILQASAVSVDFTNDGRAVQEEINAFVSEETREFIPKVLDGPPPETTLMALVNALYFKGKWAEDVEKRPWEKRSFRAYKSDQPAEWIGLTEIFAYASSKSLRAEFVEIPYRSRSDSRLHASMLFILPDESLKLSLEDWLKVGNFTWDDIGAAIRSMKREDVSLTFPEFKIESQFFLKEALMGLGMKKLFTTGADFSGMLDQMVPGLILSDVIHKAKIVVDEDGTEAAAVTGGFDVGCSPDIKPIIKLVIDHPFVAIILLRDETNIVPLFTAMVNEL